MRLVAYHKADNAVGQYRILIPCKYLARLAGWHVVSKPLWMTLGLCLQAPKTMVDVHQEMSDADLAVWQWFFSPFELGAAEMLRAQTKTPIVLELDDDVFHVPPDHMAYEGFRKRSPEECAETIILPGPEAIQTFTKRGWRVGYQDGHYFAVRQKAVDFRDIFTKALQLCDAFQATSPFLLETYRPYLRPGIHAFTAPNCFDPDEWRDVPLCEPSGGPPRLLWAGSNAHTANIRMILPALKAYFGRYPEAKILCMGAELPVFKELGDKVEYIGWCDLEVYPRRLAATGAWIGLAPSVDDQFSRAKSHIRWMEYALAGIPAICSPMPEYVTWAGASCLYAQDPEDWEAHLVHLTEDAAARDRMRRAAKDHAWATCHIEKQLHHWVEGYTTVLRTAASEGEAWRTSAPAPT